MGQVRAWGMYRDCETIADLRAALIWARDVYVYSIPLDEYVQVSKEAVRRSIKGRDGTNHHAGYVPGMNQREHIARCDDQDLYIG